MDIDLVVSRFKENVDWIHTLCERRLVDRVFIYNKGPDMQPPSVGIPLSVEQRPNVGRDIETYLRHIAKHYDDQGGHTLFLQGNPHEHAFNVVAKLTAFRMHPSLQSKLFVFSDAFSYDNETNNPRWAIVYRYLFYGTATDMAYGAGAQYLVSREAIRHRSVAFYNHALGLFDVADRVIGAPGVGINADAQPGISAADLMAYPFEGLMPIMWDLTTPARK